VGTCSVSLGKIDDEIDAIALGFAAAEALRIKAIS
jgi:hypothetical protein